MDEREMTDEEVAIDLAENADLLFDGILEEPTPLTVPKGTATTSDPFSEKDSLKTHRYTDK